MRSENAEPADGQGPAQSPSQDLARIAVVGAGRLGSALAVALRAAGLYVDGPSRRGEAPAAEVTVVLLCVPDHAIGEAAAAIEPGPLVGHCSGVTTLGPLGDHRAFSLHPLITVPAGGVVDFAGVVCAVAGHPVAGTLAGRLGMSPIRVEDEDRAAYHAASCMASNSLVTLEHAAGRVGATAGLSREDLLPLVRATVENWARLGPDALTGPIARGDIATVELHRQAPADRAPDLLALYDTMAEVTRR
ncbi:MAG TPA: DUF2520 domain-containing protein [Propionicimonas sp.]|jgi:predicted short-subunit dehydrogenase-like oxidoreductase (DUF2520 family)